LLWKAFENEDIFRQQTFRRPRMRINGPKPSPELKKLGYFVGTWITRGAMAPGPWGDGGKFSWKETTKWMTGRFFLVGHWNFKMPADMGGYGEELLVVGFDTRQSVYTLTPSAARACSRFRRALAAATPGRGLATDSWTAAPSSRR
jgi:hypothetical protein